MVRDKDVFVLPFLLQQNCCANILKGIKRYHIQIAYYLIDEDIVILLSLKHISYYCFDLPFSVTSSK